ncbi:photosynthetic NDH subunit of lumenal location 1, chloroplastic-like [Rutidosis leptorrhynchoides]|uniref:photosynthetic NDH subunit of lumenal location 1, chloroplastic-like n=1 Tax=Rutidosis leptorrhynchoides TaxID=125765 RepID=UPI003A99BA9E
MLQIPTSSSQIEKLVVEQNRRTYTMILSSSSSSSSLSLNCVSPTVSPLSNKLTRSATCSISLNKELSSNEEGNTSKRSLLLLGVGGLTTSLLQPTKSLLAQDVQERYSSFVDKRDGYSYIYPSDWREFDFRGHDSAFKDRFMQLHNVRVSFIPTQKKDIHDLGPIDEVAYHLVKHVYATPNQIPSIYTMEERSAEGKNYYTIEYELANRGYSSTSFATVAIGNGRYYTLIVGANERRWRRYRNQLKVVADSFKMLDI